MFSAVELDYIKSLVESMRGQGYGYYIARTVSEQDNIYDAEIVFSTTKITASGLYDYSGISGVRYRVDSTTSYRDVTARVVPSSISGTYTVPENEFVYTNAEFFGATIQPDVRKLGGERNEQVGACVGLLALLVLVCIAIRVFR